MLRSATRSIFLAQSSTQIVFQQLLIASPLFRQKQVDQDASGLDHSKPA